MTAKRYKLTTLALLTLSMSPSFAATETPEYVVLGAEEPFEVREYGPSIVAQTTTEGEMDSASNQAFRRLAGYIFGDNTVQGSEEGASEKIAMTAPVTTTLQEGRWVTRFMMPAQFSMEDLPLPNDSRVETLVDPGGLFAAVRFSGLWSDSSFAEHLGKLEAWMAGHALEAIGEPIIARYDPPRTPWFMRRNEILIPIEAALSADR